MVVVRIFVHENAQIVHTIKGTKQVRLLRHGSGETTRLLGKCKALWASSATPPLHALEDVPKHNYVRTNKQKISCQLDQLTLLAQLELNLQPQMYALTHNPTPNVRTYT